MHGGQRVVLVDQGRVDAGGDAGLAVLDHGEQLDDLVFGGGCGDVVGGDLGDASTDTSSMVTEVWKPRVAMMAALLAAS